MALYICMTAAILITVTVILWKTQERETMGREGLNAQTFLVLALIDTCILYIPWFLYLWPTENGGFKSHVLLLPYMVIRLMQTVSMDADYEAALKIASLAGRTGVSIGFLKFYTVVLSYVSVMVPLAGILTILGFFGNQIGGRIATSRLSFGKTVFVFNGAGARNLNLAESIWEKRGRKNRDCIFLFCNVLETPGAEAAAKIRRMRGWYTADYPSHLLTIIQRSRRKEMFYFLLEDEEDNYNDAVSILRRAGELCRYGEKWSCADRVKITMTLSNYELSSILDSQDKYGIFVRLINMEQMCAQDLFSRWPLYTCLSPGQKTINMVIIGGGKGAEEILLNALWMGQIASAQLKIRLISERANQIRNKLIMTCPALFDPETAGDRITEIEFENVGGREELGLQNRSFDEMDYIVVAGNNDNDNIQIAMWLRTWSARDRELAAEQPFIAALVRDEKHTEQAEKLCVHDSRDISYDLHIFGTEGRLFDADHILRSDLVGIAHRIQLSYEIENLDGHVDAELNRKAWDELNRSVYNYRSSEASALYLANRLFDAGAIEACMKKAEGSPDRSFTGEEQAEYWRKAVREERSEGDNRKISEIMEAYTEKIKDPVLFDRLAETEHRRWIAYMAGNGWVTMPADMIGEWLAASGGRRKDYLRLRHPAMASWKDLEERSLIVTGGEDREYYKNMDRLMVERVRFFIGQ